MLLTIVHDNNGKIYYHEFDEYGAILLMGNYDEDNLFVSLIDTDYIDYDNWKILDQPIFIDPKEKLTDD
jgi:hypothetical protein